MRLWRIAGILWLGLLSLGAVHADTAADAMLTQASDALASGQYAEAKSLAAAALSEPELPDLTRSRLHMVQGLAQQVQGAADGALLDFTIALQGSALQGEERSRALFARGLSLDGQGRLEAAVGDYSAALAVSPRATYALNNRANVYRRQGRLAEAKRDYIAALAADTPNPQYPWYGLGQIAESEGDTQTARGFYNRALAFDSGFLLARERLQGLGAAGEAGVPVSAEIVVLKLPPPKEDVPFLLRPPGARVPAVPMPAKAGAAVHPTPVTQTRRSPPRPAASPPMSPPGRGMPLRPALTEGAGVVGPLVQLGAWRSEAEARAGWAVARAGAEDLLGGLFPLFLRVELPPKGTFYRLRIAVRGTPIAFCAALSAKGLACLPVRD